MTARQPRGCEVVDCRRPHYGRGYCRNHWSRWRRYGSPTGGPARGRRVCSVEGCGRRHYGHGLCATHLARFNSHGDVRADVPVGGGPARRPRLCEIPDCGRRHVGHGYCRSHLSRRERLGDVRADVPVEHRIRGVSYWSAHHRVVVERGPASDQACAECAATAVSWSYDGTDPNERTSADGYRYSLDLDRYRPRCHPCLRRATIARSRPRAGAAVADVERAVWFYQRGVSAPGIAARMNVSRTAVYTALRANGVAIRARGSRAPLRAPTTPPEPDPETTSKSATEQS